MEIEYDEFNCYSIILQLHRENNIELTENLRKLSSKKDFTPINRRSVRNLLRSESISSITSMAQDGDAKARSVTDRISFVFALEVISAMKSGNYHKFAELYSNAVHLSSYLLDFIVSNQRNTIYNKVLRSYLQGIDIDHLSKIMCFASNEETYNFLSTADPKGIVTDNMLDVQRTLTSGATNPCEAVATGWEEISGSHLKKRKFGDSIGTGRGSIIHESMFEDEQPKETKQKKEENKKEKKHKHKKEKHKKEKHKKEKHKKEKHKK